VTGKLSLKDILAQEWQNKFMRYEKNEFSMPASSSAYWLKFSISNRIKKDLWIEAGGGFSSWFLDFYRPDSLGNYGKAIESGSMRPEKNKEYRTPFYCFYLADKNQTQSQTYYLRVNSKFPLHLTLRVGSEELLAKQKSIDDYFFAAFVGLAFMMLIYGFLLYLYEPNKIIALHIGFIIFSVLNVTFANSYPLLFPSSTFFLNYYLFWSSFNFLFAGFFAINFLQLRKKSKVLYRIVLAFIFALCAILPLLNLIGIDLLLLITPFQGILLLYYCALFYAGVHAYLQKDKNGLFYALGWIGIITSLVLFILSLNGIIESAFLVRYVLYFGSAIELIVFSVAIAGRIKVLINEKNTAEKEAEAKAIENEKILREQNQKLAEGIEAQTSALKIENEKVALTLKNLEVTKGILAKQNTKFKSLTERFELSIAGSNDGIWDWDMAADKVYFSPRWKEMLGYQDEDLVNSFETFQNLVHPDDIPHLFQTLNDYLAGKEESYMPQIRMRCKDGSYKWILSKGACLRDEDGKPYRMSGSHSDISEMKAAETRITEQYADLQASEEELKQNLEELNATQEELLLQKTQIERESLLRKAILKSAPLMIIATDSEGLLTSINLAAEEGLGYKENEVVV
jgi:PAS domain S-box-containing protein